MTMTGKKKILVVDDEQELLRAVRIRLEAAGYEVLTALDGQEGLEKARREKPALIILDLMLPKMDGYRVCAFLKKDTRYAGIPIVMFTARAQQDDIDLGMEMGADAYITKPFDHQALIVKVKELLEER